MRQPTVRILVQASTGHCAPLLAGVAVLLVLRVLRLQQADLGLLCYVLIATIAVAAAPETQLGTVVYGTTRVFGTAAALVHGAEDGASRCELATAAERLRVGLRRPRPRWVSRHRLDRHGL